MDRIQDSSADVQTAAENTSTPTPFRLLTEPSLLLDHSACDKTGFGAAVTTFFAPAIWNSFQMAVTVLESPSLVVFKSRLETFRLSWLLTTTITCFQHL